MSNQSGGEVGQAAVCEAVGSVKGSGTISFRCPTSLRKAIYRSAAKLSKRTHTTIEASDIIRAAIIKDLRAAKLLK